MEQAIADTGVLTPVSFMATMQVAIAIEWVGKPNDAVAQAVPLGTVTL